MPKSMFEKYDLHLLEEIEFWDTMAPYTCLETKAEKIAEVLRVEPLLVQQALNDYALAK